MPGAPSRPVISKVIASVTASLLHTNNVHACMCMYMYVHVGNMVTRFELELYRQIGLTN